MRWVSLLDEGTSEGGLSPSVSYPAGMWQLETTESQTTYLAKRTME